MKRNLQKKKKKKKKMRTKSFAIRSSRNSLDPSPSLASLPDERFGGGVSTRHSDVETVPDTFDERDVPHKKRHCLVTSETGIVGEGSEQPLNTGACIVCDVANKWVSRCSGIGCILSFHGECLNAEFGGIGEDLAANPQYCPYCWFKVLALKSKPLRDKAIEAEKAVFKYLDKERKSGDEVNDTTLSGDENGDRDHSVDSRDIVSDQELQGEKDSDKSRGEKMPLIEETDHKSGDMEEDKDAEDDGETAQDQTKVNTGARKKGDASSFLSMQESFSGKEGDQVQQNEKASRRRRLILNATDSEMLSNESTGERNGEDVTEQITSSAQVAPTEVAKSKTVRGISFFKDQRRRLLWTSKEEEMLKVGVEKFAAEAKKNMPWRKILEMGEKVFSETRTPADLKDKWRNMQKKK